MQTDMFMEDMITKVMKSNLFLTALLLFLSGCTLAPGMHFDSDSSWDGESSVYIEALDQRLKVEDISAELNQTESVYRIGVGDQISFFVWGLPEIFPVVNVNVDQNLRRIDSNGDIFFPFVGTIKAVNKTQNELRSDITIALSEYFNDPQLDVTVARFNSQKVYLLGEVTRPKKINLTDIPLSLADALGESFGINTNTAEGSEVFVIRQASNSQELPRIFRADLSNPAGFLAANEFFLKTQDIVYVNAKGTTRWNRVVSQFFPFSTFLNSIDNLTSD